MPPGPDVCEPHRVDVPAQAAQLSKHDDGGDAGYRLLRLGRALMIRTDRRRGTMLGLDRDRFELNSRMYEVPGGQTSHAVFRPGRA
jgi:hypothetical protein